MEKYCEKCSRSVETKVITKPESYNVHGETIEIDAQVLVCAECGEELYSEELDNTTLLSVYSEYRKRHNFLQPEEIRSIREQYVLSVKEFALLLGWEEKTIHRYENGTIQNEAHNSLLSLLRDPENMRKYLAERLANSCKRPPAQAAYIGAPDSETVASYIEKFNYHPEKREQIQKKYKKLLEGAF